MSRSDADRAVDSTPTPIWNESERLAALDRYAVLDTPREPEFDDIVRLASDIFGAPISVVNLIASGRQWFKAEVGIGADELPLDVSICAHALLQPDVFVVPDTTEDPRFDCNPLVTGEPGLRFYAGALLTTPEGLPLGTVCVLDTKPRPEGITDRQRLTLEVLARQVMTQLELRRALADRDRRAERHWQVEDLGSIQKRALELAIEDRSLSGALNELMRAVEARSTAGLLGSILLLDEQGERLRHGAGPSLPAAYNAAIDGIAIGPGVGSCGTAAHAKAPVHVTDIATDPLWTDFRDLALSHGLRACWSTPIMSGQGAVLGTFAMYYPEPREPSPADIEVVDLITRSAALIIERKRAEEALRETAERYRLASRATNDAIWDWEFASNHVQWNEALQAAYGHPLGEVAPTGDWWIEHIHPDDRARIDASIHAAIDGTGDSWSDEYRFCRADGSFADVLDRGHIIRDETERATRMIGAMLDLTERRRSEAALSASEMRYRTLFDSVESGFCTVEVALNRPDGRVDYRVMEANPAFYAQTGFPETIAGRWLREAVPDLEEQWYDTYGRVAATGIPERFEQGSAAMGRWFDVYAFRTGDAADRRVAILFNDISARRSAEERLRELNETLELQVARRTQERDRAWRLSQELQVVATEDGVIEAVNARWAELLGWSDDELIGTEFALYVHPDDLEATLAAFAGIVEQPLTVPFAYRFRAKDGPYRWFGWTAAFEDGRVYAVGRDLTAEREQAAELARAEEQLRQAQKMEAVGQLTGGIAHDFNNLLTGITGSLEMMQVRMAQGRTGDVDRYVTAAQGAAKRAAALTHRLLAFSRRQTLAPKPTDVRALVSGMEELIGRSVGPAIEVETVNAAGLWTSLIDPSQLENAVLNLCINARDAMPDGGKITIETGNRWMDRRIADERGLEPGQYISLCVSDTGTGMTPDVVSKVFEPFFTTKPIGMGTGLGLSMIYGFAKQSGGTVSIYSEVGQGTMVCIYLPRYNGDATTEGEDAELAQAPRAEAGETVLVVDDEPTVRMLVAEVLTDLGYTAIEAGEGAAGLKIINSDVRIDLLVTDVGLPGGMNGRQVADAARAVRPGLKVLFITGYAENAVLSHGHLDPGMQVLTKPFSMEALASGIKEILAG